MPLSRRKLKATQTGKTGHPHSGIPGNHCQKSNDPGANSVTFHVSIPGKDLVVKKTAVDMYEAVVDATSGAMRQLRKHYERRRTLKRASHHRVAEEL